MVIKDHDLYPPLLRSYTISWEPVGFVRLLACRAEGIGPSPSFCSALHSCILYNHCNDISLQVFRAEVRIVDPAKKAALSKMLLQGVSSTLPDEKLDEKLVALTFHDPSANRKWGASFSCLFSYLLGSATSELRRTSLVGLPRTSRRRFRDSNSNQEFWKQWFGQSLRL